MQIYQIILIYGIFSGSFLANLELLFFHKVMIAEKNNFPSNAQRSFAKIKVISECKNDKP